MMPVKARVRATGKNGYVVKVEGIGEDGKEAARYSSAKQQNTSPELCARQCAGAYVKGYNQAVQDVCELLRQAITEVT
jgi:hypothetical protein